MPEWSPLQVGLIAGLLAAVLWSARVIVKHHGIAGVWMLIEVRFWRSLATNFVVSGAVVALLASIIAGIVWLLHAAITAVLTAS